MRSAIPAWAMQMATPADRDAVRRLRGESRMQVKWPSDRKALRGWARDRGWPTPWFGFEERLLTRALEDDQSFALALSGSGIEILIPKRNHTIPVEELRELDLLYDERSAAGYPTSWGILVEELRQIRRAIEAGVEVEIEGKTLNDFGSFYNWAHGRYHMLEDGYDKWIGNDD